MGTVYKDVCQCCGKEFESLLNPAFKYRRKYCSRSCSALVQHKDYRTKHGFDKGKKRPNYTGLCKNCGKEFTRFIPLSTQKSCKGLFCSGSCKSIYQWKDRKLTVEDRTKTCEYCGKDFVYSGNNKGQRFCSLECANRLSADLRRKNDRTLTCDNCGKEFVRNLTDKELAKGKGKYCSRECHNEHFAWVQLYCEQCGKPLKRGYGSKYCSHQCAGLAIRSKVGHTIMTPQGYVLITVEDGRRIPQHRHVMEQMLGRQLFDFEKVHHLDGKRSNNDPGNLEIWLNGHPGGQRLQDIYRKDVERLALENYKLKQ